MSALFGQLILGWLLADLLTGVFHWWEDSFCTEDSPLIGKWLIAPNRLHHIEPLAFTKHGFWARNLASIVVSAGIGGVWLAIFGPSAWLFSAFVGTSISNEVHFYAHCPARTSALVRVLQQTGLFQSPKGHAAHHRPPQKTNFCVLSDWLNPLLGAVDAWGRLERATRRP